MAHVFCEVATPHGESGFKLFAPFKEKLVQPTTVCSLAGLGLEPRITQLMRLVSRHFSSCYVRSYSPTTEGCALRCTRLVHIVKRCSLIYDPYVYGALRQLAELTAHKILLSDLTAGTTS